MMQLESEDDHVSRPSPWRSVKRKADGRTVSPGIDALVLLRREA